ncbi:hypothetical protein SKAU_G00150280 [Synaphobranchus kaupii]|uniref:Uncharacterized protein n=1 Tax=Synaphobranchus kaupii TaxID=118154 RepID=A0A9Q1J301_SYNKA|nr:hypothetical protein SKAU_G00150280 [Synaphobranchus kaupii]
MDIVRLHHTTEEEICSMFHRGREAQSSYAAEANRSCVAPAYNLRHFPKKSLKAVSQQNKRMYTRETHIFSKELLCSLTILQYKYPYEPRERGCTKVGT